MRILKRDVSKDSAWFATSMILKGGQGWFCCMKKVRNVKNKKERKKESKKERKVWPDWFGSTWRLGLISVAIYTSQRSRCIAIFYSGFLKTTPWAAAVPASDQQGELSVFFFSHNHTCGEYAWRRPLAWRRSGGVDGCCRAKNEMTGVCINCGRRVCSSVFTRPSVRRTCRTWMLARACCWLFGGASSAIQHHFT